LLKILTFLLLACNAFSQSSTTHDSIKVRIIRVIDGDTYLVKYANRHTFKIRLRCENPRDTLDTFDSRMPKAGKQAARFGISVDSVRSLSATATAFVDSLLRDKIVRLRRYDDQTDLARQFSYDRLLRGVEYKGRNLAELLRERRLTVDSFTKP
jgi:endonuclease YncB( thermonuclease family)